MSIGGFDLIFKKIPVKLIEISQNGTLLGTTVNRKQAIKKLAIKCYKNKK